MVIGICGGTGSGKTTITEHIISATSPESVLVLQQDHYEPSKRCADVIIPEGGYNQLGIDLVIQKLRLLAGNGAS